MISAKIVADSIGPNDVRLTTFVLTYPRFIHAEFMTHRVFSRNASSSRAIPVKKQIQMVIDNPVIPLAFTKNKAGMQGGEALTGEQEELAVATWLAARNAAVLHAQALCDQEVHKQYANRVLEPFAHITVVATATDLDNFFTLRCHYMAQPEINVLATEMLKEFEASVPKVRVAGSWHLPFIEELTPEVSKGWDTEKALIPNLPQALIDDNVEVAIRRSVARCARVSYLNHEGKNPTLAEDLQLYDRLLGSAPIHASPAEHQAMATDEIMARSGNLRGWIQYRKTLENENVTEFKGPVYE